MLKIRLSRTGKKHQPHYRLVVAEHTAPIQGRYVDLLGHYNPRSKDLVIKNEQIVEWLNKGAQPSNTVAKILKKAGIEHKSIKIHIKPERASKKTQDTPAADAVNESKEDEKTENTEVAEKEEVAKEEATESSQESVEKQADTEKAEK